MSDSARDATTLSISAWPTKDEWLVLLRRLGAATLAGLFAGFVVGGIGGRLAMFVLRLTSDDSLRGIETDDGFIIGSFTTDTVFFVVFAAAVGMLLAVLYLVVRRWLPAGRRALQAAVFFGIAGGSVVIVPGGVDFTFVDPLLLAVVLFIALPAAYGAVMAASVESLLEHPDRWQRSRLFALAPLVIAGFASAVLVLVGGTVVVAGRRWPRLRDLADGPIVTWTVRAALVLVMVVSSRALIADVTEIL